MQHSGLRTDRVGAAPVSGNAVSIVRAPAHVPFPNLNGTSPRYTKFSSAPPFCINAAKTYTAVGANRRRHLHRRLLPKYAPVTVNNFVFLAGYHFYDGIVFHRVIPGFMDQGGDPTGDRRGRPRLPVQGRAAVVGLGVRHRLARHGQRRSQHQRQPVLRRRTGRRVPAEPELQRLRPGDRRA